MKKIIVFIFIVTLFSCKKDCMWCVYPTYDQNGNATGIVDSVYSCNECKDIEKLKKKK